MREKASPFLNFALIASASLHAALLGGASLGDRDSKRDLELDLPDRWSSRSVEVGTVPDEAAPTPTKAGSLPIPAAQQADASKVRALPQKPETIQKLPTESPDEAPAPKPRLPKKTARESISKGGSSPAALASKAQAECAPGCKKETSIERDAGTPQNLDAARAAGDLGESELPLGVRHFATAFVRAVPAASYSDPAWSELPLGAVGEIVVEIQISAEGRIEEVTLKPEVPPQVLKRMTDRAILLLKSGVFSLDRKSVGAGIERLSLAVTLAEGSSDPDEAANPRHLRALAYEAPTRLRAGYARFTLNSGREMRAVVRRVEP
jgi:hypothetical protein